MKLFPLAGAVALAIFLVVRRNHLGRFTLAGGALVTVGLALWGVGVVEPPSLTTLIEDIGQRLGKWTYLFVGVLAFAETGAFVGLVVPGETTILIGGVVAGQGEISIYLLIGLVWACAVAGDLTSYMLGRRLGRDFMVRHGPRVKITEERLEYVEDFFDRRGGITILIGRFIGLVRAIAPFIAGASRMELRKFIPYDVLGAGVWSALFCLLGYFFWQSLDRVEAYIGRGLAAFTALVVVGLAVGFVLKLRRDDEFRATVQRRLDRSGMWRHVRKPVFFIADHAQFGLELTTLLALAAVGTYVFFGLGALLGPEPTAPFDAEAFDLLGALYTDSAGAVIRVLTHVGSYPVTAARRDRDRDLGRPPRPRPRGPRARRRPRAPLLRRPYRQGRRGPRPPVRPALRHRGPRLPLRPLGLRDRLDRLRGRDGPRRPPLGDPLRDRHDRAGDRRRRRGHPHLPARPLPLRRPRRPRPRHRGLRARRRRRARHRGGA